MAKISKEEVNKLLRRAFWTNIVGLVVLVLSGIIVGLVSGEFPLGEWSLILFLMLITIITQARVDALTKYLGLGDPALQRKK